MLATQVKINPINNVRVVANNNLYNLIKYFLTKVFLLYQVNPLQLVIYKAFCGIINLSKSLRKRVIIMNNGKQTEKEIQEKIKKVDGAMAQEGMPLTKELKQKLYNCIIGKSSTEIERKKIIEKYRGIYG